MSVDLTTLNIEVNSSRVKEASKALDDLTASAAKTEKKVDELGDTSKKTGDDVGGLGTKTRKTSGDVDGFGKYAERTTQKVAGMGGVLGKVGSFISGLGLLGVSKSIVQMASDFEQLQIRLNQTMGGVAQGAAAFDWIKQFAKDTPYEVKNVTDAFMRMRAYGIDPMNGSMKSVADAAAKLGGGYETLDGLSRGLGQAWAKQKLQGEEIMQLVERGVPVWDMLAKVTGKTTQEVMKMSEKGLLGRDVIQKLMDEMGRDAAGSAAAQMDSFSGKLSNLMDRAGQWVDELRTSSGFLKVMGFAVEFVTNHFDGFMFVILGLLSLGLPALFGMIGSSIAGIATTSAIATKALFAFTVGLATNPIFLAIAAIAALGYAMYSMRDITIEVAGEHKRLGDVASETWAKVKNGAVDATNTANDVLSTFVDIHMDAYSAIGKAAADNGKAIKKDSQTASNDMSTSWSQMTAAISGNLSKCESDMQATWNEFTAWIIGLFPDIPAAWDSAMSLLPKTASFVGDQLVSALGVDTVNRLKDAFKGLSEFVGWVLGGIMVAVDKVSAAINYVQGKYAEAGSRREAAGYSGLIGDTGKGGMPMLSVNPTVDLQAQALKAASVPKDSLQPLAKALDKNTSAVNHGSDSAKKSVNEFQKMVSSLRIKSRESTGGGKALDGTYAAAKDIQDVLGDKLKYFSAFNDKYHAGTGSKHAKGLAFDLSLERGGRDSVAAVEKINALLQRLGLAAGKDYKVLDEYKNPSERATAGHIHVQLANAQVANSIASNNEQTSTWVGKESEADKYIASLNEQNQTLIEQMAIIGKKTELEKMDALILVGKYGSVNPAERARMANILAVNEAMKAQIALDGFKNDNADKLAAMQQENDLIGLSADAVERLTFARELEKKAALARVGASPEVQASIDAEVTKTIQQHDVLKDEGNAKNAKINTWGGALQDSWNGLIDDAQNTSKAMKSTFDNAFNGIGDALGSLVTTGKADFKSLASSILGSLSKVLMNQAFGAVFGKIGIDGGSGFLSNLGSLFGISFSDGGFTGFGGKYEAAGVVHKGEVVFSQDDIKRFGGVAQVEQMRLRGYSDGGIVGGSLNLPNAPTQQSMRPVNSLPGNSAGASGSVNVYVTTNVQSNGESKTETSGSGSAQGMKKFGDMMAAKALEVIQNEMRQGGCLSSVSRG